MEIYICKKETYQLLILNNGGRFSQTSYYFHLIFKYDSINLLLITDDVKSHSTIVSLVAV